MIDIQKMVAIALREVGYHEKASNAYLDDPLANEGNGNFTKYGRDLDAIPDWYNGKKNGYEWCNQYADWPYVKAYGVEVARELLCRPKYSAGAGCVYSAGYFKAKGRWFSTPKVGDHIYFDYGNGINHVGIVVAVTNTYVVTVEGNSNGQVQQCQYALTNGCIAGYGRPCWELFNDEDAVDAPVEEHTTCKVEVEMPVLQYGDVSWHVSLMQLILMGRGFSCGPSGADGDFGGQTKVALYEFQKASGLNTDCICDSDDWGKLLSV